MIAENDINYSNTIDPADLDWYYTSVRLLNGDEIFALCATEKDKASIILQHPIRVKIHKTGEGEDSTFNLTWSKYNPFSDDQYTRFSSNIIHSMNFLNDKFREKYKEILKQEFGEEDDPDPQNDGQDDELPGEAPVIETAPTENIKSTSNDKTDFIPVVDGNVKGSVNRKLH